MILNLITYHQEVGAQKYDYVWVRGTGDLGSLPPEYHDSFMDFKTNPPTITIGKKNWPLLNCKACISDSTGKLLFFTNLLQVYNATEGIMVNGDKINYGKTWINYQNSGYPWVYCAKIIPIKKDSLFLMIYGSTDKPTPQLSCTPIKYAIIDPYFNNNQGKVLEKDVPFHELNTLDYNFVKHGNGKDWWIILYKWDRNLSTQTFYRYLVNKEGKPDSIGEQILNVPSYEGGFDRFSQQGNKYIVYSIKNEDTSLIVSYDFDRCTGLLKTHKIINFNKVYNFFFFEVSPNGRYIYPSQPPIQYQIDLESDDNYLFMDTLAYHDGYDEKIVSSGFGYAQLTPYNEILVASIGSNPKAINFIHKPDLPGQAADFEQHALIGPVYATSGPQFPNYRLKELAGSPCDTIGFVSIDQNWVSDTTNSMLCLAQINATSFNKLSLRIYDDTGYNVLEEKFTAPQANYCFKTDNLVPGTYTWYLWVDDKRIVKGYFLVK